MGADVAAVILNWNCAEDTIRCTRAVTSGAVAPPVIVVDNGSADDSVARLESLGDAVSLVRLDRNLGFAGGMNAGIRAAHARGATWAWLLNADCVPAPGALATLLELTDRFDVLTSLQVTSAAPDAPDPAPYVVAANLPGGKVRPVRCAGCAQRVHEVDVVTGAAILVNVAAVLRVGLFDERFFHYKEEFDLVRRMAGAGGRIGFVCASTVWHQVGGSLDQSSPRARYYYHRNEILYVRKHYARPLRRLLLREPLHYRIVTAAAVGMLLGTGPRRRRARAVLAAYWDGVRGVHGPTERF
jgi:GT2 family glycosyltransferase